VNELKSADQWKRLLEHSDTGPVIVFKHSSMCPVSGAAYQRMERAEQEGAFPVPVHLVTVQVSRGISNTIAEDLGLRHQSPQVIVVKDRQAVFDASHMDVEPEAVSAACTQ
jgi:bacillithiol system protein YtxJ